MQMASDNLAEDWRLGGYGLYLHWPFCTSKCPYCDFNSHVTDTIDTARWARAFTAEIARVSALTGRRRLDSVFFGGGTPSLMAPDLVATILEKVREVWDLAEDAEITMEANPGSVESGRFRAYAEAGVNRLSLGVQALNDADLRRLGRMHSAAEARAAFDIARRAFSRVSFDLIYARQYQNLTDWRDELAEALRMAADHLSLYQLTIEQGTVFGARAARGLLPGLPDDDSAAHMYLATQEICAAAGLPAYEVSNHAAQGAEGRHNLVYWRAGDYAGVGPGAHGRLTLGGHRLATDTHRAPAAWLAAVEGVGTGEVQVEAVPAQERASEYLLTALRLAEGLDLDRFSRLAGSPLDDRRIESLSDDRLVELTGRRLRATPLGRPVLDAIIRHLLPD
jgi:oxygen-independent coproporphyrinogen-3 oxidase